MAVTIYQGRNVAGPQSPVGTNAPQTGFGAFAEGVQQAGEALQRQQDELDIAEAKQVDADMSNKVRDLLYADGTGYMYSQGGDAVSRRDAIGKALERLKSDAMANLRPGVARVAADQLEQRYQSSLQTINQHASRSRIDYFNEAGQARISASLNDAIYNPAMGGAAVSSAMREIEGMAARNGWPPEVTAQRKREAVTQVHGGVVERLSTADPIAGWDYLNQWKGQMDAATVVSLESRLMPAVKAERGRRVGAAAAGNVNETVFRVAADTLGMNENQQRDALADYLSSGGQNLDPAVTAWCAAYVNATLARSGATGTGSLAARSFLNWGEEVSEPQRGDVVVLSRGNNPAQGHVGFFDGFNADGSVRILGGNQGNSVSIAGYPVEQVLGYRRAGAGQGVGGGIEAILDMQDPVERDAAMAEYTLRSKVSQERFDAQRSAAQQRAFLLVEQGGSVDQLTIDERAAIGQEGMNSLRTYQGKVGETETDPLLYMELTTEAATNPQAFMQRDPLTYINSMSKSDFRAMIDKRNKISTGGGEGAGSGLKVTEARTAVKTIMDAAGVDTSTTKGAKTQAKVEADMMRWYDQFSADNGRAPTNVEVNKRAQDLVVPVVIDPPGWNNEVSGQTFAIDWEGVPRNVGGEIVREGGVTLESLMNSQTGVSIGGVSVPPSEVQLFVESYTTRYGVEPTPREVVEGLIASGRYTQ